MFKMFLRLFLRIVFCFIASSIFIEEYGCTNFRRNDNNQIDVLIEYNDYFDDFPTVNDVLQYLQSLRKISDFARDHRTEVDMNLAFALSIVTDNFSHVLMRSGGTLPNDLKVLVQELLNNNGEMLLEFEAMVALSMKDDSNMNLRLSSLFTNRTLGVGGIKDFYRKKTSPKFITKSTYPSWKKYVEKVNEYERWKPSPREANRCLASVAKNKFNRRVCKMSSTCYVLLVSGTNFGYSLTHRLLILLQAYRGRGCRIFSIREDQELLNMICLKIFREANYIAANQYKLLDLLLEQMTLCSLAGHMDTLRRSWLAEVIKHQTPFGCFTPILPLTTVLDKKTMESSRPWRIAHNDTRMLGGACDRHLTAVAAGALSGAIRYVLEKSY